MTKKIAKAHRSVRPRWTKDQVSYLKTHYKDTSNIELAKDLKRPVTSVVFKAFRLNLSKSAKRLKEMGQENILKRWKKPAGRSAKKG
jgi:hypothetical protein